MSALTMNGSPMTVAALPVHGHAITIDRESWDVCCSCGEVFKRDSGDGTLEASIAEARNHVRMLDTERRRVEREAARAKTRAEVLAERLKHVHGQKNTRELATLWGLSRGWALRYLNTQFRRERVKRHRDRTWPHGYLWSKA